MLKKLLFVLLALAMLLTGPLLIIAGFIVDPTPVDFASGISAPDDSRTYHVSQMMVWERFHYDSELDRLWFRASVETEEHGIVTVALLVDSNEPDALDLLDDCTPSHPVSMDCVVQIERSKKADGLPDPTLEDLITRNDGLYPVMENYYLTYFTDTVAQARIIMIVSKAICLITGVLPVVLGLLMLRSLSKKKSRPLIPAAPSSPQVRKQLESYQTLLDQGLITQEEFDKKRHQILGQ